MSRLQPVFQKLLGPRFSAGARQRLQPLAHGRLKAGWGNVWKAAEAA